MNRLLTFFLTALLAFSVGWAETVTDVLNRSFTGITGSGYSAFTDKTGSSGAVYAGQCAGGNSSIQLRATNPSGIVSTTSAGKVKKVTVVWNSNTSSGRTLNIYGSNTAYTTSASLYETDGSQGTLLGTIVYGTSTEFSISGDYTYIGLRSNSGAMYLTSISIEWETGGGTTVTPPTISPAGGNFATSQTVTISHSDADAIYYTTDGNDPTTSSTQYSAPFTITSSGTTTVKAIAVKDGVTSTVASETYTNIGVANIADALDVDQGSQFIFTGSAVVTYQNGRNVWIRDNSGSGLIYRGYNDTGTFTNGDILNANWSATNTTYNNSIPEFSNPSGVASSSNGGTVAPFDRTSTGITTANVNEYVSFSGIVPTIGNGEDASVTINGNKFYFKDEFNLGLTIVSGKNYNIEGIAYIENGNPYVYMTKLTSNDPVLIATPNPLTFNDSGTGNTFTVEGSNLGTDNVGLTQTDGTNFDPTLSATTGSTYDGGTYWGFTPAGGSVNGIVAMEYIGRALSASETVTLSNNTGASATVTVDYLADLYIVGNFGSGWDFSTGTPMTYNNGTYTASVTVDAGNLIVFARKYDTNELWNTRYLLGPSSSGDWWVNGDVATGTIDLNDDDPIYFSSAGTYIIEINASTGALTVTKEVVNTGDFVLVTDATDLVAGNEVIIVNSGTAGAARTMGQRNNNNYYGTDVTVSSTLKVTPTNDTQIFTLEQGTGGWYFKTTDDLYLNNMGSGTNNYLQTNGKDANGTGTSLAVINIGSGNAASIVFQGSGSRKTLQYNPNGIASNPSANDIFSCYNGNQQPVYIYQREASSDEPSITVNPSTIDIVIPAGETSEQGTATVTEINTTGTTSVSVSGEDAKPG